MTPATLAPPLPALQACWGRRGHPGWALLPLDTAAFEQSCAHLEQVGGGGAFVLCCCSMECGVLHAACACRWGSRDHTTLTLAHVVLSAAWCAGAAGGTLLHVAGSSGAEAAEASCHGDAMQCWAAMPPNQPFSFYALLC